MLWNAAACMNDMHHSWCHSDSDNSGWNKDFELEILGLQELARNEKKKTVRKGMSGMPTGHDREAWALDSRTRSRASGIGLVWNSKQAQMRRHIQGNSPGYTNLIWAEDKNRNFFKLALLQTFPPVIVLQAQRQSENYMSPLETSRSL